MSLLYTIAKQGLLTQTPPLDLDGDTIKATLINTALYTASAAHQYMNTNTVAAASKVATATLAGKTGSGGMFDSNDAAFPSVTGSPVSALILWKDGGGGGVTAGGTTDVLVAYVDGFGTITPDGGDITVAVNALGWFQW